METAKSSLTSAAKALIGCKLQSIFCACEMLMFDFGPIRLHAQGFTRLLRDGELLTTTLDFQSWDGEDEKHNDEWSVVDSIRDDIMQCEVLDVLLSSCNDLLLYLSNGFQIECLIANGAPQYEDEQEQYRLLCEGNNHCTHIIVKNKVIEMI